MRETRRSAELVAAAPPPVARLASLLEQLPAGEYRTCLTITRIRRRKRTGQERAADLVCSHVSDFIVGRRRP